MPHDLRIRELLLQSMKQQNESILLVWSAVVDRFAVAVNATHVGNVDGRGVLALHTVADQLYGEKLMDAASLVNHVMITRIFPTLQTKFSLEILDALTLRASCAMHENAFNLSHLYCDLEICF